MPSFGKTTPCTGRVMALVNFPQPVFGMRIFTLARLVYARGPDSPMYSTFVAVKEGLRLPNDAADVDAVPFLLRHFCIL
jgi:hypothetical protein